MKTLLKSMILPIVATALLSGTAANAQMLMPKSIIMTNGEQVDLTKADNAVPFILVDNDEDDDDNNDDGKRKKRGKKRHLKSGDDDDDSEDEDKDDDDDDEDETSNDTYRQQTDGSAPDNGLFKKGTKPTAEVQ